MANPLAVKTYHFHKRPQPRRLNLVLATAANKANPQPELLKHKVIASCAFSKPPRVPACRLKLQCIASRQRSGFSRQRQHVAGKKGETLADTIQ